jgi:hypothetical protein
LPETCKKFEMKLVGTKVVTLELRNTVHSCSRHGVATVRLTLIQQNIIAQHDGSSKHVHSVGNTSLPSFNVDFFFVNAEKISVVVAQCFSSDQLDRSPQANDQQLGHYCNVRNLSASSICGLNTAATISAASLLKKPTSTVNLCSFIPCNANYRMSCPPAFRQFSHVLNIFLDTWQSSFLEPLTIIFEDFKYLKKTWTARI